MRGSPVPASPTHTTGERKANGTMAKKAKKVKGELVEVQPLTADEKKLYRKHGLTVRKGMKTFIEVAVALYEIREKKLYRERYSSFEEYCKVEHDLTKQHGYRISDAGDVVNELQKGNHVVTFLPTCEAHVRPMVGRVPEGEAADVWQEVVTRAKQDDSNRKRAGLVTQALVRKVVNERYPRPKKNGKPKQAREFDGERSEMIEQIGQSITAQDLQGCSLETLENIVKAAAAAIAARK